MRGSENGPSEATVIHSWVLKKSSPLVDEIPSAHAISTLADRSIMNNPRVQAKKEHLGGAVFSSSSSPVTVNAIPQPIEGLHDLGPPPFLTKTYEIVDDPATNHIVSWSKGNNSFVVWDAQAFAMSLLPRYFKHNNFSSFIRQLNTYGFRKVDPDKWEFANEGFLRGQKYLLKNIRRRRTTHLAPHNSQQVLDPCVEVGRFGLDGEIDRLKRDKQVLMMELIKLRQQQQTSKSCLQVMEQRLKKTEMKQHQMMNFLARAMKNPDFLQQLVQQKDSRKELAEVLGKNKRRCSIDQGPSNVSLCDDDDQPVHDNEPSIGTFAKVEPQNYGDIGEFERFELEKIVVDMDGGVGASRCNNIEEDQIGLVEENENRGNKALDEVFWEDLFHEGNEQTGLLGVGDEEDGEDMNILAEQLGYLSSIP